jgi:phytoene dehydrogenase-like protein
MADGTRQQTIQKQYDCVVIGAGNGGLAAAARLAVAGKRVLLLEQHNIPGGFASSFRRGRFEFEVSLHQFADIGSPSNSGSVREFFEDELGIYLDWVEVPEAFRLILTDPEEALDITMPYGVDAFVDALEKAVPGSRPSVTKYLALCQEVLDGLAYVGQSRGNPDRKLLLTQHTNFLKTAPYTADQVAEALKIPEQARKILHAEWSFIGTPTNRTNFTIYGGMLIKFIKFGAWIPRQRSHEIALAFDARIRELGGEIQYNTRVEEILVEDGKVTGVLTSNGDRIATEYVVSNASPTLVYNQLIQPKSEVPTIALQGCNARLHGLSGFVVYLGLDASPEELGLGEYSYFIYRNMNSDASYASFKTLDTPEVQAAVCLNNAIPDCSPPGTSIVFMTTLYRPEVWHNVKPQEYFDLKNKIALDLISDFEEATGASLRDHIEEFEVATPQTFARYTGSHDGGIYGYEPEPWDSLLPRMMMLTEDQHIGGLQFSGGSAFRCHGYSSSFLSGQVGALLTVREMKERGGEVS